MTLMERRFTKKRNIEDLVKRKGVSDTSNTMALDRTRSVISIKIRSLNTQFMSQTNLYLTLQI